MTTPEAIEAAIETFIERMGIADDQDMPTHLGSSGWLIAMGSAIAAESDVLAGVDAKQRRIA